MTITNLPLDEQGNLKVSIQESLQTRKDAVEITVLDWTSRQYTPCSGYPIEWRVKLDVVKLPFVFSPKPNFLNVTNLWITVIASTVSDVGTFSFNATINDATPVILTGYFYYDRLGEASLQIEDTTTITEGINVITLSNPTADFLIYKVTVFIEYEYQA